MTTPDFEQQQSYTQRVIDLLTSQPLVLFSAKQIALVGGFCAWRSRVSDARQQLEKDGRGTIVWNRKTKESAYMFLPYRPLGREASAEAPQQSLF